MAGSTLPAVKNALVTLLQADSDLAGVQVAYSWPGSDSAQYEVVYLGNATAEVSTPTLRGPGVRVQRQESYLLNVWVEVVKDATQHATDARAVFLAQQVDEAIADAPKVGVLTNGWAVLEEWEHDVLALDTHRGARIRMGFRVTTRVT